MNRLLPLLVCVALLGNGCALVSWSVGHVWNHNDRNPAPVESDDLRSSEARTAAAAAVEKKAERLAPAANSQSTIDDSQARKPALTGYRFTDKTGYVWFVKTNAAPWTTNGPLAAYPVTEIDSYGDAPHASGLTAKGPWTVPATNCYVWKWTPGYCCKATAQMTNQCFRGHVAVKVYAATLPVWEVSYLTNFPT